MGYQLREAGEIVSKFMDEYVKKGTPQSKYVTSVGISRIPNELNRWKVVVGLQREPEDNLYLPGGIEYKTLPWRTMVQY